MNEFQIRLNILIEILIKKKEALMTVQNICENEETIFLSGEPYPELLESMAAEKQKAIMIVLDTDELFQSSYDSVKEEFEQKASLFRDEATKLKALINDVCEQDIKIRLQEEKNKRLLKGKRAASVSSVSGAKVADSYIKNAKNSDNYKKV